MALHRCPRWHCARERIPGRYPSTSDCLPRQVCVPTRGQRSPGLAWGDCAHPEQNDVNNKQPKCNHSHLHEVCCRQVPGVLQDVLKGWVRRNAGFHERSELPVQFPQLVHCQPRAFKRSLLHPLVCLSVSSHSDLPLARGQKLQRCSVLRLFGPHLAALQVEYELFVCSTEVVQSGKRQRLCSVLAMALYHAQCLHAYVVSAQQAVRLMVP